MGGGENKSLLSFVFCFRRVSGAEIAQTNQETQKKGTEYFGRRRGIARWAEGMWQPSREAEIFGIWGMFSLDSGRWVGSNSTLDDFILDV